MKLDLFKLFCLETEGDNSSFFFFNAGGGGVVLFDRFATIPRHCFSEIKDISETAFSAPFNLNGRTAPRTAAMDTFR